MNHDRESPLLETTQTTDGPTAGVERRPTVGTPHEVIRFLHEEAPPEVIVQVRPGEESNSSIRQSNTPQGLGLGLRDSRDRYSIPAVTSNTNTLVADNSGGRTHSSLGTTTSVANVYQDSPLYDMVRYPRRTVSCLGGSCNLWVMLLSFLHLAAMICSILLLVWLVIFPLEDYWGRQRPPPGHEGYAFWREKMTRVTDYSIYIICSVGGATLAALMLFFSSFITMLRPLHSQSRPPKRTSVDGVLNIIGISVSIGTMVNGVIAIVLTWAFNTELGGKAPIISALTGSVMFYALITFLVEVFWKHSIYRDNIMVDQYGRSIKGATCPKATPIDLRLLDDIELHNENGARIIRHLVPYDESIDIDVVRHLRITKARTLPLSHAQIAIYTSLGLYCKRPRYYYHYDNRLDEYLSSDGALSISTDYDSCAICLCEFDDGDAGLILNIDQISHITDSNKHRPPPSSSQSIALSTSKPNNHIFFPSPPLKGDGTPYSRRTIYPKATPKGTASPQSCRSTPSVNPEVRKTKIFQEISREQHAIRTAKSQRKRAFIFESSDGTQPKMNLSPTTALNSTSVLDASRVTLRDLCQTINTRGTQTHSDMLSLPLPLQSSFQPLSVEADLVRQLPCFHTFHSECCSRWLSQKPFCPVCRRHVILSALEDKVTAYGEEFLNHNAPMTSMDNSDRFEPITGQWVGVSTNDILAYSRSIGVQEANTEMSKKRSENVNIITSVFLAEHQRQTERLQAEVGSSANIYHSKETTGSGKLSHEVYSSNSVLTQTKCDQVNLSTLSLSLENQESGAQIVGLVELSTIDKMGEINGSQSQSGGIEASKNRHGDYSGGDRVPITPPSSHFQQTASDNGLNRLSFGLTPQHVPTQTSHCE